MGGLREITRTAAFAWSPNVKVASIATGTKAGAVDADFSSETKLEIWDLDLGRDTHGAELQPTASIGTDSRFYNIAWSQANADHPEGIIAGALENGSLDLWDTTKLKTNPTDALISRTSKHSGAIKALQFNPHRPELLATSGVKSELYITDLNNASNPFRLGTTAARADDFDCLDWNKKVPHILVTGGSGGFVTVWDVKAKKESLTLNNYGRKPVSAVAWNPDIPTKLATAIPSDQDPVICLWDLRNSSAPERVLKGHEQGVLSLSWCTQDNDLLLSCGKDNRNICWDPHTGQILGEFPIVTNWTFQTSWNPHHPSLLATASFDGKIAVQSIQNTNSRAHGDVSAPNSSADGEDFFAKAQTQPQGTSFSLLKPPKWLKRPVGVSFGFGGKLVRFGPTDDTMQKSTIKISTFVSDSNVESSISDFQTALKDDDLARLCDSRLAEAQTEASKEEWKIIRTLVSDSPRKQLLEYLGFAHPPSPNSKTTTEAQNGGEESLHVPQSNGSTDTAKANRLSAFFDTTGGDSSFLADLAASKGARTNNPFHIFTSSESSADKHITRALMLGSFDEALEICLKEKRMSDAFMVAICGGQKCIDKAQAAYFAQQSDAPNYLRLLASVVGKNLWDLVYNADLENWAGIMATLCTYADETEFPDLCEALGDRLEESEASRKNASFCYLAGSKLEKVVPIWIEEMQDVEVSRAKGAQDESAFSIHVHSLQQFIEKVSIFRRVTKYADKDGQEQRPSWKLGPLYRKYVEYADVVAAHGHLGIAEQYLALLPNKYPAAEVTRNRVAQATKKVTARTSPGQRVQPGQKGSTMSQTGSVPSGQGFLQPSINAPNMGAPYAPAGYQAAGPPAQYIVSPYAPPTLSGYQAPGQNFGPPPSSSPNVPPSGQPPTGGANGTNWNDLPEAFATMPSTSRRGTPGPISSMNSPFTNQSQYAPPVGSNQPPQFTQPRTRPPVPPPPKAGSETPRMDSPLTDRSVQTFEQPQRPHFATTNSYAPQQSTSAGTYAPQQQPQNLAPSGTTQMLRSTSPYNPPPSAAPPSNRYAPASGAQASPSQAQMSGPPGSSRPIAPHPSSYAPPQPNSAYRPSGPQTSGQGPPSRPPTDPRAPQQGSPQGLPPGGAPQARSRTSTGQSQSPHTAKHPPGDRSHIPADSLSIYETLNTEMQRVKSRAPSNFKAQVDDTEKRLNILFDHLNNDDVLKSESIAKLKELCIAIQSRNFELAQGTHTELMEQMGQAGPWMVGVKRLIAMGRATP